MGLFAPGKKCSAAATLVILNYFILPHQPDFDVVWCRGKVGEKISCSWVKQIGSLGAKVLFKHRVTDVIIDHNLQVKSLGCGDKIFDANTVIFSVGITGMKKIVASSPSLQSYEEFRNLNNLGAIAVLATRLWFDRKSDIPRPSNACFGFDDTTQWTFFDLNALHDELKHQIETVVEVDFDHANQYLNLNDQDIVKIVQGYLASCIPEFKQAKIIDSSVIRLANAETHFSPGTYRYMLPAKRS